MGTDAAAALERRKQELIAEFGPWSAHNIYLGHGVFTIGGRVVGQETRLRPLLQVASDVLGGIEDRTILDLACMEGLFAIEFARQGAKVLGVDGRQGHVARAAFAAEAIGLENVEFRQGDVREFNADGKQFDLVLALGILYHLDAPDVFEFVHAFHGLAGRAAIIDTHYALRAEETWNYEGSTYSGISIREHDPTDSAEERERAAGSSLDNVASAWLTKPSLFNLLGDAGFTSVYELVVPVTYAGWDRTVLLALKGEEHGSALSAPQLGDDRVRWSEDTKVEPSPQQARGGRIARRMLAAVPSPLRKKILRHRRN